MPLLALFAVAAESSEDAKRQVGALRIFKLRFGDGQSVNLPSAEAAADFARQIGVTDYRIDELHPQVLAGTAQEVHRELDALHERFGIDEFVIDNPVTDPAKRLASVEALARVEQPIVV